MNNKRATYCKANINKKYRVYFINSISKFGNINICYDNKDDFKRMLKKLDNTNVARTIKIESELI